MRHCALPSLCVQTSPAETSALDRGLVVSDPHWKDIVKEEKRYCANVKKTFQGQVLGYVTPVSLTVQSLRTLVYSVWPFVTSLRASSLALSRPLVELARLRRGQGFWLQADLGVSSLAAAAQAWPRDLRRHGTP